MLMEEKNNFRIMEMENESHMRNASRERDNFYKIQSINAYQRRTASLGGCSAPIIDEEMIASPRCLNTMDPESKG